MEDKGWYFDVIMLGRVVIKWNIGYSNLGKEFWECMVWINWEGMRNVKSWRGWFNSEVCREGD